VRLVYYAFDLLTLMAGMSQASRSLSVRRCLSRSSPASPAFQFNGQEAVDGEIILKRAGKLGFEGVVSKTIDALYGPGNRDLWRKAKWLNGQEFVVVGGATQKERGRISRGCCWGATLAMASSPLRAVRVRGCPSRFLPICGAAWIH
jgi:bifunctional non-homologous end joining protein LigD